MDDHVAVLRPLPFAATDRGKLSGFGAGLNVSHGAGYIAVLDSNDSIGGLVTPPPASSDGDNPTHTGVYIFEKRGTGYALRRHISLAGEPSPTLDIVANVGLAQDGKTLVVGEPGNRSDGTGIQGDRSDASLTDAGAFWLY